MYNRARTKKTFYKASILKSIIQTITPGDDIPPKIAILDKHLSNDDNDKEYQVCSFIDKKIKSKLAINEKEEEKNCLLLFCVCYSGYDYIYNIVSIILLANATTD